MRLDLTNDTLSARLQNVAVISASAAWDVVERHSLVGRLSTEQLVAIVTDAVDVKQLAHDELVSRGVAMP